MIEFEDKYVFTFHKLTKSWRKGRHPLSVEFCAYQQNPNRCIVQARKPYLQATQARNNFFLVHYPHIRKLKSPQ